MSISELIEPERVVSDLSVRSRKHALEELSALFAKGESGAANVADAFDSLFARERLGSTALGNGVALPHGRVAGISACVGAFMKLAEPLDFDAPDDVPVNMIFGLLVPLDYGAGQLKELAVIATAFRDDSLCRAIAKSDSSQTVYDLLVNFDPDHPATP